MLLFTIPKRAFSSRRIHECYRLLQINAQAEPSDIRQRYLELIRVYHPDNKETGNAKKFIRIKNAYEMIKKAPLLVTNSGSHVVVGDQLDEAAENNPDGLTHKAYVEQYKHSPESWLGCHYLIETRMYGGVSRVPGRGIWKRFAYGDEELRIERDMKLKNIRDDF